MFIVLSHYVLGEQKVVLLKLSLLWVTDCLIPRDLREVCEMCLKAVFPGGRRKEAFHQWLPTSTIQGLPHGHGCLCPCGLHMRVHQAGPCCHPVSPSEETSGQEMGSWQR